MRLFVSSSIASRSFVSPFVSVLAMSLGILSAHCAYDAGGPSPAPEGSDARSIDAVATPARSASEEASATAPGVRAPRESTCVTACGGLVVCSADDDLSGDGVLQRSDDGGGSWSDIQVFPRPSFVRPFFEDTLYGGGAATYRVCARTAAGQACGAPIEITAEAAACQPDATHSRMSPSDNAPRHGST